MFTIQCAEHPEYKGAHAPAADCAACWLLWETRQDLQESAVVEYGDLVLK